MGEGTRTLWQRRCAGWRTCEFFPCIFFRTNNGHIFVSVCSKLHRKMCGENRCGYNHFASSNEIFDLLNSTESEASKFTSCKKTLKKRANSLLFGETYKISVRGLNPLNQWH